MANWSSMWEELYTLPSKNHNNCRAVLTASLTGTFFFTSSTAAEYTTTEWRVQQVGWHSYTARGATCNPRARGRQLEQVLFGAKTSIT